MNEVLTDLVRHQAWAAKQLSQAVRLLGPEGQTATTPGAYGGLVATLYHAVQSEGYYCYLLADGNPGFSWDLSKQPSLDELDRRIPDLEAFWQKWLENPVDPETIVAQQSRGGGRDEARTSVLIAQLVYHGTAHREQVSAILTSLGASPPEIDAWTYGVAVGRVEMSVGASGN
jgi:uncharacterized damage-inducible protein DinB